MTFFSYFPRKFYSFPGTTLGMKQTVDITKRLILREYAKNNANLFIKYQLKAHEDYTTIAQKLYGKATYHWILMLLNEIVDPWTDIPVTDYELNAIIKENYSGYSLFMKVREFDGNFITGEQVKATTASIDLNTGNRVLTDLNYRATVLNWNSTYRELAVTSETHLNDLNNSDVIIVGLTSGATATYKRRVLRKDAVHHFIDSITKETLNPLPNPISGDISSPLIAYTEQSQNSGVTVITNTDFEEDRNYKTKSINIIRPEYVEQINREIQTIFSKS